MPHASRCRGALSLAALLALLAAPTTRASELVHSTYVGGVFDHVNDVEVGPSGDLYISADRRSDCFDAIGGGYSAADPAGYVARLSPSGDVIWRATFPCMVHNLAVGPDGSVTFVGYAEGPVLPLVNAFGGTYVAPAQFHKTNYVAKLDATGSTLVFSSYTAVSTRLAYYNEVVVDDLGRAWVFGGTAPGTAGVQLPIVNALQPTTTGPAGNDDTFLMRVSPTGALEMSTLLGGARSEIPTGLGVAPDGSIVAAGGTDSADFPVVNAPAHWTGLGNVAGSHALFAVRVAPDGQSLEWSRTYGPPGGSSAGEIVTDGAGDILMSGAVKTSAFPVGGANLTDWQAWVMKTDGLGEPIWSTQFGGTLDDFATALDVDASGSVRVAGQTRSLDLQPIDAVQTTFTGRMAALVATVGPGGNLEMSSYLGGAVRVPNLGGATSSAQAVAVTPDGETVVVGMTNSSDFPVVDAQQSTYACPTTPTQQSATGFLARIAPSVVTPRVYEPSALDLRPGVVPLEVRRGLGLDLVVSWEAAADEENALHAGSLSSLWADEGYDHVRLLACDSVPHPATIQAPAGGVYFLVTQWADAAESSYGRDSLHRERLPSAGSPCR